MKKNIIALSFAAAALFAGCAKENLAEETAPEEAKYVKLTLNASFADADTKSALGDDAHSVKWVKGDAVSVFIGGTNYKFTADEAGESSSFTGEVKESDAASEETIYAVYPYSGDYKLDGTSVEGVVIPAVQTLTAGGYDPAANVSVASGKVKDGLEFKNVCTLVKVHLDAETAVRGAQLTCPSGFALAGTGLKVDAGTAEITFPDNYAGCTNTVNLINNTKEGVSGTDFYMAAAPNPETGDFKLSVFNAEEKYASKAFTTTKEFLRDKIITVNSAAPSKDSYVHYGTANCICLYGKAAGEKVTVDVTPYIASDSFIATGLVSFVGSRQANTLATGNVWREKDLTGVTKNGSVSDNSFAISRADATTYGNMSIAFKRGNSVVWSYHVWVPEDDPDAVRVHNGYEVMPMALGAINSTYKDNMNLSNLAGLFYQWGRKDPMGRRDFSAKDASKPYVSCSGVAITAKSVGEVDVIGYSVTNPTVMISDNTSSKNDALWANPVGYNTPKIVSKSIYDPCPEGYMVAPCDVYVGVVAAANVEHTVSDADWTYAKEFARYNGFMFGDDLVSAPGFRSKNGVFSGDGAAHYWTSTFKASGSKYPFKIFFDNTGTNFNSKAGSGENAQACCVRCVKVK